MICKDCANKDHKKCIKENKKRDYPSCDCQHRVTNVKQATKDINGDGKKS